MTTKHFVVLSDLDETAARTAATTFETSLEELRAVAFPRASEGPRLTIVLFQEESERHAFRPSITGAEYADRLLGDLERSPTIVMNAVPYARDEQAWRETFLHELTHAFIRRTYGGIPLWLNEGLAEYLSTMRVEDGKAILGEKPPYYQLTPGFTPTVGELLAADRETFYGGQKGTYVASGARYRYYSGAWALVHLLENGPDPLRAKFRAFIHELDAGALTRDAWARTLGTVPAPELEETFLTYMTSPWNAFEREVRPAPPSPVESVRALSDVEVHLLWARLSEPERPPADPGAPEAQVQAAADEGYQSEEVRYRRGCLALLRDRPGEAAIQFDEALRAAPKDPRFLYAAIVARTWGTNAKTTGDLGALGQRLAESARTADELTLAARMAALAGHDAEAMRRVNDALTADPGYSRALAGRAAIHFLAGRYGEAVADQERAVALAPEQTNDPGLMRKLRQYQKALASTAR